MTAVEETCEGMPLRPVTAEAVGAGLTAAARYGMRGTGVDPFTGQPVAQLELLRRLLTHVGGSLESLGDTGCVAGLLQRLHASGTGADRQRGWWAQATSAGEFVESLARSTLADGGAEADARTAGVVPLR